jgi:hypothetical protein
MSRGRVLICIQRLGALEVITQSATLRHADLLSLKPGNRGLSRGTKVYNAGGNRQNHSRRGNEGSPSARMSWGTLVEVISNAL